MEYEQAAQRFTQRSSCGTYNICLYPRKDEIKRSRENHGVWCPNGSLENAISSDESPVEIREDNDWEIGLRERLNNKAPVVE